MITTVLRSLIQSAGARRYPVCAVLIVAVAGALRVWGIATGLPDVAEPDEPKMVHHALAFGLGDFDPRYYHYPHLPMYLLFGCYGLLFLALLALGRLDSVDDFKVLFLTNPSIFYLVGRGLVVGFACGSVWLMWRLGRRLYGSDTVGLLAAGAFATYPVHVLYSHYVRADVPVTFFVLLGLLFISRIPEDPRPQWHVLAGMALGLATSTKYTGLILLLPLAAQALTWRRTGVASAVLNLAASLATACVFFSLTSPYAVINWRATLEGMRMVYEIKHHGQFGLDYGTSWGIYTRALFLEGFLPILCLLGLLYAAYRRRIPDLILLALAVPYFVTVARSTSRSPRYLVLLAPVLFLFAARLVVRLWKRESGRWLRLVAGTAFAAGVVSYLAGSVAVDRDLGLEETRIAARKWIERAVPDGSTVAIEWGGETVRLKESRASLDAKISRYCREKHEAYDFSAETMCSALKARRSLPIEGASYTIIVLGSRIGTSNTLRADNMDLGTLADLGVQYVVTGSTAMGATNTDAFRQTYPDMARFYDDIRQRAELIQTFEATPGRLRGPMVSVWRLPGAPAS